MVHGPGCLLILYQDRATTYEKRTPEGLLLVLVECQDHTHKPWWHPLFLCECVR
jgi:hypothetical protein